MACILLFSYAPFRRLSPAGDGQQLRRRHWTLNSLQLRPKSFEPVERDISFRLGGRGRSIAGSVQYLSRIGCKVRY